MSKKEIFTKAWRLASLGAVRFGGKKSDYFVESLKITYAESRKYVLEVFTSRRYPAWCAKITGSDERFGFKREFLDGYGSGQWHLSDGIYNYGRTGKDDRDYIIVENGHASVTDVEELKMIFN